MRTTRSLVLLTLLAVGCGSSSSPSDAAISEAGTFSEAGSLADAGGSTVDLGGATEAGAQASYCTAKPALANVTDLTGVWVAKLTGAQIVTSALTKPIHNENVYYQLLTIQQTGTAITVDGRYCDRTEVNDPSASVPVEIPDAWAHTETPIHRTGDFTPGSGGYSVLNLPTLFEAIGARLTSADTLPTGTDDSRVYDEDNDGNPGITIHLSGLVTGNVYSVQAQTTSILAIPVSANRVEGSLGFASNQTVLASSPSAIKARYESSKTAADFAVCASTFVMVKLAGLGEGAVDGGSDMSCTQIRADEAKLFQ